MDTSTRVETPTRRARRPRRRWVLAALGSALAVAAFAVGLDRERDGTDTPSRPELQHVLDGLVAGPERIAPGATAYVSGPHGTWSGSAGVSNLSSGEPMAATERMRLESVSKIYTATVVLLLARAGALRLDDTVERWLPGALPYGDEITIRQLLTMRSGLIDTNDLGARPAYHLARVGDPRLRAHLRSIGRRLAADPTSEVSPVWWVRWAAWEPLLFEPGSNAHYSNIGYELLGLIAARAGGAPLVELYRQRIFAPLGLRETAYDPQGRIRARHAHGYMLRADTAPVDATNDHAAIGAGGGIVSNAEETATFLRSLMQGKLLGRSEVDAMRGQNLWLGGERTGCAGPAYGWSGGGNGYKTNVWVSGDGSRVAVLLLNARMVGDGQAYGDGLAGAALARLYCAS